MSAIKAEEFARTALKLFPPYQWDGPQEDFWIDSVMENLAAFSDQVIERGLKDMVQKRRRRDGVPAVSDCIDYCSQARRWMELQEGKENLALGDKGHRADADRKYSDERKVFAETLIVGPMGREAVRDGWIIALRDFAQRENRLPKVKSEIKGIDDHKGFLAAHATALVASVQEGHRMQGMMKHFAAMGENMMAEQKRLALVVQGKLQPGEKMDADGVVR